MLSLVKQLSEDRVADDEKEPQWKFKKEVSVGDILLAVSIAAMVGIPMFFWGVGVDRRLTYVEAKISDQQETLNGENQLIRDSVLRIEGEIRDLNLSLFGRGLK